MTIIVACAVLATLGVLWRHPSKHKSNEDEVPAAEDQVYEAVVEDILQSEPHITQLVFDRRLLTELKTPGDINSCRENARKHPRLENSRVPLPYDSFVDKIYRYFAHDPYDNSLRDDTIQDFVEKVCTSGSLSQTFHTDLPKRFVASDNLHFSDFKIENGQKSFERLFPGAAGVMAFSRVGFDSTLDQALVATSFICGGLCGTGSRYSLKKTGGHWEVVNKWIVWVS